MLSLAPAFRSACFVQVSHSVCGPLMAELAKRVGYGDAQCVELLRRGGPLMGVLERSVSAFCARGACASGACRRSGRGIPIAPVRNAVSASTASTNREILEGLREDPRLRQMCLDDAELGRMGSVVAAASLDLGRVVLSPRFCLEQGACRVLAGPCSCV